MHVLTFRMFSPAMHITKFYGCILHDGNLGLSLAGLGLFRGRHRGHFVKCINFRGVTSDMELHTYEARHGTEKNRHLFVLCILSLEVDIILIY